MIVLLLWPSIHGVVLGMASILASLLHLAAGVPPGGDACRALSLIPWSGGGLLDLVDALGWVTINQRIRIIGLASRGTWRIVRLVDPDKICLVDPWLLVLLVLLDLVKLGHCIPLL